MPVSVGIPYSLAIRSAWVIPKLRLNVYSKAHIATSSVPVFENEEPKTFAKGSQERLDLDKAVAKLRASFPVKIPLTSGGRTLSSAFTERQQNPSQHKETVALYVAASPGDVNICIDAALGAKESWDSLPFEQRSAVFMSAADLVARKYRSDIVAATMLGQGKNAWQAEIDAAAEICDFFRAYVSEGYRLLAEQPKVQAEGDFNVIEHRPLDGFVYAVSPFNFTALGATLVGPAALMGNPVIWKPSPYAVHASWMLYQILIEAGLPKDLIQFVPGDAKSITDTVLKRREFAGLSFIGSTAVFKQLLGKIGKATAEGTFNSYPRVVGESGGKNFHLIHASADVRNAAFNTIRAAFEYSGQKCSACSRVYVAESVWPEFQRHLVTSTKELRVGEPEDYANFINPVIHERSFDALSSIIEGAKHDPELELVVGGNTDKTEGYFVSPTIYKTQNPRHELMKRELFGPILTIYPFPDKDWESIPKLIDTTSSYALTGAVFAQDPSAAQFAQELLKYSAGNFYINAKCTGAVVAQQPFGGSRDSGTNDKTGTMGLLSRWVSPRTIKQQFSTIDSALYPSNEV